MRSRLLASAPVTSQAARTGIGFLEQLRLRVGGVAGSWVSHLLDYLC